MEIRRLAESNLESNLKELLKSPILGKNGDYFIFEVESPYLLDYLQAKIKSLGYPTDGSFVPSIIKLSSDSFVT